MSAAARVRRDALDELRALVTQHVGIRLPPEKSVLLESRLVSRLRALGLTSLEAYRDAVLGDHPEELTALVDVVTTNTTEFFREAAHFDHLRDVVLPTLQNQTITVWSAGCSSGEEVWTLCMVLAEFEALHPGFGFRVVGTDISQRMLHVAKVATYPAERAERIPPLLRERYLRRGRGDYEGQMRVVPELRARAAFGTLNFMDAEFGLGDVDVIFFRNVGIYFDAPLRQQIVRQFANCLVPGGHLYIGASESLTGLDVPFERVGSSIYKVRP